MPCPHYATAMCDNNRYFCPMERSRLLVMAVFIRGFATLRCRTWMIVSPILCNSDKSLRSNLKNLEFLHSLMWTLKFFSKSLVDSVNEVLKMSLLHSHHSVWISPKKWKKTERWNDSFFPYWLVWCSSFLHQGSHYIRGKLSVLLITASRLTFHSVSDG